MPAIYVDPVNGSDTAAGGYTTPLQTLTAARNAARALAATATEDVDVWLKGGDHLGPLTLTPDDSGPAGYMTRWRAFPEQRPIITDRIPVTGWNRSTIHPNVYVARVGTGLKFRAVYLGDGSVARFAAYGRGEPTFYIFEWDEAGKRIKAGSDWPFTAVTHLEDIELVIPMGWALSRIKVASFTSNTDGTAWIVPQEPGRVTEFAKGDFSTPPPGDVANVSFRYGPYHQLFQRFWVENDIIFLSEPGEFYYDKITGDLYVYAPDSVHTARELEALGVWIPGGETLAVSIYGDANLSTYVDRVSFEGISFACMAWDGPTDNGYIGYGSGIYGLVEDVGGTPTWSFQTVPGAAFVAMARECRFIECTFDRIGHQAMLLGVGCKDVTIQRCLFNQTASTGLSINAVSLPFDTMPEAVQADGVIVQDCWVRDAGTEYGSGGIQYGGAKNGAVRHCRIERVSHAGITVGFGARIDPNWIANNKIHHNRIDSVMLLLTDGAGIYTNGNQTGTYLNGYMPDGTTGGRLHIYGNHISNCQPSGFDPSGGHIGGIYNDLGARNVLVNANFIENCETAFLTNGDLWSTYKGNRVIDCTYDVLNFYSGMNRVSDNPALPALRDYYPPTSLSDTDPFFGTGAYTYAFREVWPFATINDVFISVSPLRYASLSEFSNNTETTEVDLSRTGFTKEGKEYFDALPDYVLADGAETLIIDNDTEILL